MYLILMIMATSQSMGDFQDSGKTWVAFTGKRGAGAFFAKITKNMQPAGSLIL
jgi:hypothetical protein